MKPLKINNITEFKKKLRQLNFIELSERYGREALITNKNCTKFQRYWSTDWLGQISKNKKTKEWFIIIEKNFAQYLDLNQAINFLGIIKLCLCERENPHSLEVG